jgi:hypothetical protein
MEDRVLYTYLCKKRGCEQQNKEVILDLPITERNNVLCVSCGEVMQRKFEKVFETEVTAPMYTGIKVPEMRPSKFKKPEQ